MVTSLLSRFKRASRLLPVALLPFAAHAQGLNYFVSGASYTTSTYTDLGTTGTVIATANNDDASSTAQPIGFTFNFNGQAFTEFVLNTNGFIKLGATAPSAPDLFLPEGSGTNVDAFQSPGDLNLIVPFNFDLQAGTSTPEYRVTTTGTSPNQVCTIQWKNVQDKAGTTATQYDNFSFQVKLYETTNVIDFVYNTPTASSAAASVRYSQAGLKGSGFGAGQFVQAAKSSGTAWSAATFASAITNNTLNTLNFRNNVVPVSGATYRFVPASIPANDDPAGAVALNVGTTCSPTSGINALATTTTPNGYTNGTNANTACGVAANPKDVWYKFTTTASGPGSTTVKLTVTGAPAGYVRVFSSPGGAATGPFTEVACASGGAANTVSVPLTANSLTPSTTYYVSVSGYDSNDNTGSFTICATSIPANDAAVTAIYSLGTASSTFSSPVTAQAVITNIGTNAQTNLPVTLTVSGATTYTNIQTVASLAPGASTTVTYSIPLTATTGTNTLTVTLPTDANAANNTKTFTQTVTAATLSYFTAGTTTYDGGFGANGVADVQLVVRYKANPNSVVRTITPTFPNAAGNAYQLLIYSANAATGLPGTVLYTSPTLTQPKNSGPAPTAIPNVPVSGDFFVAVKQTTTTNIGLAATITNPLWPNTFYFSDGTTFDDLAATSTPIRLAIDVTLGTATATRNAELGAAITLSPNPAHQRFTLSVPAGSLRTATATLANALGQTVQTRQLSLPAAGGTADFDVSRLAAGIYTLTLKSGNDLAVKRVVVE